MKVTVWPDPLAMLTAVPAISMSPEAYVAGTLVSGGNSTEIVLVPATKAPSADVVMSNSYWPILPTVSGEIVGVPTVRGVTEAFME